MVCPKTLGGVGNQKGWSGGVGSVLACEVGHERSWTLGNSDWFVLAACVTCTDPQCVRGAEVNRNSTKSCSAEVHFVAKVALHI